MALIQNSRKPTNIRESGYWRTIGNEKIAELLSRTHSTCITNGTELEKFIVKYCTLPVVDKKLKLKANGECYSTPQYVKGSAPTLSTVFEKFDNNINCFFPKLKISKEELGKYGVTLTGKHNIEVDGIWIIDGVIYVTEIKDGSAFDTKKSYSELKMFELINEVFKQQKMPVKFYMVLWNLEDERDNGVKAIDSNNYIITGEHFSDLVGLDFIRINRSRMKDQIKNTEFVLNEMKRIIKEDNE